MYIVMVILKTVIHICKRTGLCQGLTFLKIGFLFCSLL